MRHATLLALAAAVLALAPRAEAQCTGTAGVDFQRVTVREINAIPQANIDQLNANEATVSASDIQTLLTHDLEGELVEFTAAVLSDPIKSGLATAVGGIPGRIHVFVRDTTAQSAGLDGMGIQIVDGTGTGLMQQFFVGDEITICGFVSPFRQGNGGVTMQISPVADQVSATGTVYAPSDAILQPIVITTDDIHDIVSGQTQIDWSVYSDYNGQYVRFEGIEIIQGVAGDRPNVLLSSAGQDTQINVYDTSVCFRNDRDASYFPSDVTPPACIDDDFIPPSTGTINLQGFLTYQGDDGGFNYSVPDPANFVISPIEEADFAVTAAPPTVAVQGPTTIPGPSDAATITATAIPASGTITSVVADYEFLSTGTTGQITLTKTTGDEYTGDIPAGPNGSFVAFTVTATDSEGLSTTSDPQGYLVFGGDIDAISLVQTTFDGRPGDSPLLTGNPASFDLTALVQDVIVRGSTTYAVLQDNAALEPFTGVFARMSGVNPGDVVNITQATIVENFGQTELRDVTFTITSSGNALYGYKEVATNLFVGTDAQANLEAHEGMLLRFNNVTITDVNADGDDTSNGFGEFEFTTGTGELRVDDYDDDVPNDWNLQNLTVGQTRDFIRGPLAYSFSNYKLFPTRLADLGTATGGTAAADGPEASSLRIASAYPNPATGSARVRFELAAPATVALRLFDVTGRQVATVAEGAFSADAHEVTADLGGLAAGVYVLRLEADGAVATARLAIVR